MTTSVQIDRNSNSWLTPVLFTSTIFLSASLLFFVQPLFTKVVMPLVGGAPAVWTTAMLFFQTVLIFGYVYAHVLTRYLAVRWQMTIHMALWAAALLFLPLAVHESWAFDPAAPIAFQTLLLFATGVGLPFAVLSANAPLIQSWYSQSDGPSADDPYFLYGASNLGSLIALLGFPLVAEPVFGASKIGNGWAIGFVLLGLLLAASGMAARHGSAKRAITDDTVETPKAKDYAWWLLLAFIPSSLMLAVTTKISTDLGSVPLVWVLPLSLYLLTFVLVFSNSPKFTDKQLHKYYLISLCIFAVLLSGIRQVTMNVPVAAVLLLAFFFIAMKSHRVLYQARPSGHHLTNFYVTMSVGGALGGLFNSLLAPVLFNEIHEMRVTILAAGVLLLTGTSPINIRSLSRAGLALFAVLAPLYILGVFGPNFDARGLIITFAAVFVLAFIVSYPKAMPRMIGFAATIAVGFGLSNSEALFKDRSFFGAHKVIDLVDSRVYRHGTTTHGAQRLIDYADGTKPKPLYYYHPESPMGQTFSSVVADSAKDIGIVGLGVGSLACYAQPGQNWHFYEIDAMVDQVARDPRLFTFMSTCAGDAPTHIGDARIVLANQAEQKYDILVIDAYSSDAVPVHLTTNEAINLYRDRLTENGILILHITNRYYDISRPLGRSAADLGMAAMIQYHEGDPEDLDHSRSTVVAMARTEQDLDALRQTGPWQTLPNDGGRIWTDDYANPLSILWW